MPSFFKDISLFYGDGSTNEKGLSLNEYLKDYNPKNYNNPCVTVDLIVVKKDNEAYELLMIKRKNHPCIGMYALPGGFVEEKESLEEAAKRELMEETSVSAVSVEFLNLWGDWDRDPRARIITASYLSLVSSEVMIKAGDDASEAEWFRVNYQLLQMSDSATEMVKEYELVLQNKKKQVTLKARVQVSMNHCTVLKRKSYQIIKNQGFAFDHASLILDGLLAIE